jgi:hypothetical protein
VRLTDNSSAYEIGPPAALETRTLPDDARVQTPGDAPLNIVFEPDGSASATPAPSPGPEITFKVSSADGAPDHDLEINTATSRVRIVD